jgi:DNA-binding transcriptional ArsR family regulator
MCIYAYTYILRRGCVNITNALKALSDETRLRIINLLYEKELCVCDIIETLGISQTKASRHLSYLKNAGLVSDRKHAQWVYYSILHNDSSKFLDSLVYDSLRKMGKDQWPSNFFLSDNYAFRVESVNS